MRHPTIRCSLLVLATVLFAGLASASSIVPPEHLGELAVRSDAIVLARAGQGVVSWRGQLLMTDTPFVVIEAVAGEVRTLTDLTVRTPGGELDGLGWLVPGSPQFKNGSVYLLFLSRKPTGEWQPTMLSYGLLERVIGRDGSHLLAPMPEHREVTPFPREDGILPEEIAVYREIALLPHLGRVARGLEAWNGRTVEADGRQVPLLLEGMAPPSACTYIRSSAPYTRWPFNTASAPAQVTMYADATGDQSLAGGAFAQVQGAIADWMAIPSTSLSLAYGGAMSYSLTCTTGQDTPGYGVNIVLFNDPCSDIAML
jgi:hypothetical protein